MSRYIQEGSQFAVSSMGIVSQFGKTVLPKCSISPFIMASNFRKQKLSITKPNPIQENLKDKIHLKITDKVSAKPLQVQNQQNKSGNLRKENTKIQEKRTRDFSKLYDTPPFPLTLHFFMQYKCAFPQIKISFITNK